jgi:hypothetical protein
VIGFVIDTYFVKARVSVLSGVEGNIFVIDFVMWKEQRKPLQLPGTTFQLCRRKSRELCEYFI